MNCVGLAETIVELLNERGIKLVDGGINDIRIYGLGKLLILIFHPSQKQSNYNYLNLSNLHHSTSDYFHWNRI